MFLNEYILVNSLLFTINIKFCVVIIFVYLFSLIWNIAEQCKGGDHSVNNDKGWL